MGALSELPLATRSSQSVLFAEPAQPGAPQYFADEEFPPDLPVKYDWMLQPASQRSWRRAMRFLAVGVAAPSFALVSFLIYQRPRLIAPVGAGLAGVIFIGVVVGLPDVLKGRRAAPRHLRPPHSI